jgi:hypothetical protein
MGKLKRFLSDLSAMFFLGVGVSTARTKERRLDLRNLLAGAQGSGERWSLINRAASNVEYKGQRAARFDSRPGEGLAWVEGLRFSIGKIDLSVAAIEQDVGVAFHVQSEREFKAICFHVGEEARNETERQRVIVRYFSSRSDRDAVREAQFDLSYSQSGEWFRTRISISKDVIAVFINGANVPCLRVDNSEGLGIFGSVGLWVGAGSAALVTDFRIHEVRSDVERQIGSILGRRVAR